MFTDGGGTFGIFWRNLELAICVMNHGGFCRSESNLQMSSKFVEFGLIRNQGVVCTEILKNYTGITIEIWSE